jgi:hypothetical protein
LNLDTREMAKNNEKSNIADVETENGFLTLKQASEITNYSPDYIGQLIREGKIEGKQVYSSVSWLASADSLDSYMSGKARKVVNSTESPDGIPDFFRPLLYTIIVCAGLFLFILLHVFSVTLDRVFSTSYEEEVTSRVRETL